MMLRLLSIESTRLFRRALPWVALAACLLYIGLSLYNFYTLNATAIVTGQLALPGLSFDLATSLDQVFMIAMPFLVMIGAALMGDDYAQRTNQHWLIRASRSTSVLAKFALLALVTVGIFVVTLLFGGAFGLALKTYLYGSASLVGVNALEALWAPVYMTIVVLPYAALMLLLALLTRSTFVSAGIGLIYTLFIELILGSAFFDAWWVRWLPRSLWLSATFRLNAIGDRMVAVPSSLHDPLTACVVAAGYTLVLLALAVWVYRRQDVGG